MDNTGTRDSFKYICLLIVICVNMWMTILNLQIKKEMGCGDLGGSSRAWSNEFGSSGLKFVKSIKSNLINSK